MARIKQVKDGKFWFDAGWYSGEGFTLFEIGLLAIYRGYPPDERIDMIRFFRIKISYLIVEFGWRER